MTLDQLLVDLVGRQITLFLDGGRLRFRAPEGALTPELRAVIAEHRAAIVERLRRGANGAAGRPPRCVACDRQYWVTDPPQNGRIRTIFGKGTRVVRSRPDTPCGARDRASTRLQQGDT